MKSEQPDEEETEEKRASPEIKEKTDAPVKSLKAWPTLRRKSSGNLSQVSYNSRVSTFSRKSTLKGTVPRGRIIIKPLKSVANLMIDEGKKGSLKYFFKQLVQFLDSPFKEDQKFAI